MSRAWMPLYVADYLADTGHLRTAEHGAYLLLIMHYWTNGELPNDEKKLSRICRMSDREWRSSRDTLAEFFEEGWRHKRIDAEIKRVGEVSLKYASRAKKAANKRWSKHAPSNASSMLGDAEPHSHSQSEQEKGEINGNVENEPEAKASPKPTRIPANLSLTAEMVSDAVAQGLPDEHVQPSFQQFHNHYLHAVGERALSFDWEGAAWRAWTGTAAARLRNPVGPPSSRHGAPNGSRLAAYQRAATRTANARDVS